jgi:glycosyltransferase involved in cell wall biosynthesis
MSISPIELVHRAGIPAVAQLCDYWLQYAQDVDAWVRMFASRPRLGRVVERVTGVITRVDMAAADMSLVYVSEHLRRSAIAANPAYEHADSHVIHTGPDLTLFHPVPPRPWSWELLYLGRMERRKGIDLAIMSLAHLPEQATLTVVGSGDDDYVAELRQVAASAGVAGRVTFERRPRDEIPAAYAAADVVLFPVRWEEPWGLVGLEAMAVGRPVIASGRGGSGEYIDDGHNALLIDPDDGPQALARRVVELAEDPALRERLRAGGERTLQAVSEDGFNAGMLDVIEQRVRAR